MKSVDSKKLSITLPAELDRELKKVAKKEHRTVSGVVQEASRYYLNIRRYEDLQNQLAKQARQLGITTEQDIHDLISKTRSE